MKIKPVEYKVLIKPDKVEDKSEGGLYIPETVREREEFSVDRGEIIDFGEGFFEKLPGPVPQIGDKVIFNRYAGSLITIKNDDGSRENYRLCNDKDICAIIEE
jgi:chaperonin GroES